MDEVRVGSPTRGIHVRSSDASERARLIAFVRARGIRHCGRVEAADLVVMGASCSAADCLDHAEKHPNVSFVVAGARIDPEMIVAADRAGAIAILSEPNPSHRFSVELHRTLAVARELAQLRRWSVEIDEPGATDQRVAFPPDCISIDEPVETTLGTAVAESRKEASNLASRVAEAAANEDFELFYQPKVNADSRRIAGFEALIRWSSPDLGEVSPADFIPIAEELGLIETIGEWCIHEACRQSARWSSMGLDPGRIAVNASPIQFQHPDFGSRLLECVSTAGLDPAQFELEITEGCLLESEEAIATLRGLSEAGIHIAIDDFGTGYSSLQYLRRLPIHCLKIDRAFVTDLETDASARSLTAAIISLAWNLGFRVVAEGVETESQWRFLADHGCDEIQGFHFSRPLSAEDCEALLRREQLRSDED